MEKQCRMCCETKPIEQFPNRTGAKDGKRNECKRCLVKRTSGRDRSAYNAAYRIKNAERLRDYREANPQNQRSEYFAQYRSNNRDTVLGNERRYRERNRHKETARRHARRAQRPLTADDREYIAIIQNDPCVYCGGPGGTVDHIHPFSKGGDNCWENFSGACLSCNSRKRARGLLQFMLGRC